MGEGGGGWGVERRTGAGVLSCTSDREFLSIEMAGLGWMTGVVRDGWQRRLIRLGDSGWSRWGTQHEGKGWRRDGRSDGRKGGRGFLYGEGLGW